MPDYRTMYFHLAARVADVIDLLVAAQRQAEDSYIESGDVHGTDASEVTHTPDP